MSNVGVTVGLGLDLGLDSHDSDDEEELPEGWERAVAGIRSEEKNTPLALALAILRIKLDANTSGIVWGDPGVGKSSIIEQETNARGWPLEVLSAPLHEPSEFGGFPVPTEHGVDRKPGLWAIAFAEKVRKAGGGVLLVDEASCAPGSVQAAFLRMILEKVVGYYQLPHSTRTLAAANPPEIAASGYDLAAPLSNRLGDIDWPVPDHAAWARWLFEQSVRDRDGAVWRGPFGQQARAIVVGFLSGRRDAFHRLPKDHAAQGRAWPSPRSWERAARNLAEVLARGGDVKLSAAVVSAEVGKADMPAFISYLKDVRLPPAEDVLNDPSILAKPGPYKLNPARPDIVWATLGSIYGALNDLVNPDGRYVRKYWQNAWEVCRIVRELGLGGVATAALARPLAGQYGAGRAEGMPESPEARRVIKMILAARGESK